MDLLIALTIIVLGLLILDVLAVTLGADSRDELGDDWTRRSQA